MIEISDTTVSLLQEFQRRQQHAINTYVPTSEPEHNQLGYHQSRARYRLLFGGNQSGKSHAAAFDCACFARGRNPFLQSDEDKSTKDRTVWVISSEYSTIKNGIYRHLRNIIPDWDVVEEGPNVQGHRLPSFIKVKHASGSVTEVVFLSSKGDSAAREKFQAAAVDRFYIDEEIPPDIWEELEARTLATGGRFSISATLVESYEYITNLERQAQNGNPNVAMWRLNTERNKYLDQATVQYLKSKWSKETLEYRFYGKSRLKTGIIYGGWRDDQHIISPIRIPPDWPRYCAIDPGFRVCAALWVATGPDGHSYGYRELYAQNEPLWQVALVIKQLEGHTLNKELSYKFGHYVWEESEDAEHIVSRVIDPKARARSEAGEHSILDQLYTRYGLICVPADNSVKPGIEDCRFWLQPLSDGKPGIQFFNTLENFFEERRVYRTRPPKRTSNQNETIDDPIRKNNHLMDCWRYIAREKPNWQDRWKLPMFEDQEEPPLSMAERLQKQIHKDQMHEVLGTEW